jgi:subtilisin family serine protease
MSLHAALSKVLMNALPIAALVLGATTVPALASGGGSGGGGSGGGSGGGGSSGSTDADVPGEILVKLARTDMLGPLLAKYPLTLVSRFGARPIYRLKVIGTAKVKDVLAALVLEPGVMIAETNATHRSPEARRNAPWVIGTESQYVAQWAPQALRLAEAQRGATGAGVRIAVLDTGVDASHPLLAGHLIAGHDFVDDDNDPSEVGSAVNPAYGHGTHVAGLLAMVAPGATIMPLRVLDPDGYGNAWVLAEALLYAVDPDGNPATDDGAHVINLSLGSLTRTRLIDTIAQIVSCAPALPDDAIGDRTDPGYRDDDDRCERGNGAVVLAAAGNDASTSIKEYPAAEGAYGLVAVGASSANGRIASFSNTGSWIEISAPGDGITSSIPGGAYATWSGTSMATPLLAGTAALVRSLDLGAAPKDVVQRLKRSTAQLCATQMRQIDAAAAVANTAAAPVVCH